ncbi:deoxyribonuclease YjjV [Aquipluma nitroreducens]|uniref:Deoxyribonuclease YjjV n=1 Tax=Aquipluma nitroreducens TaxID=2010828 RepID=A0A5K7SGX7_9BACT|nr:TatD family hydrolase [Aquipluma nitroreducens]BBE20756.1 deoxyribonuclease YjjV [Aquipluma nitroreducens]
MQLINLHTHLADKTGNPQIVNVFAQELTHNQPDFLFSAGLHPWHIGKVNVEECFEAIDRASAQKNMLAVGECGLDRLIEIDFALQEWCFKRQVLIANNRRKPLIIHCVRAYSDLIKYKKENKSDLPWIIHGYRGNWETTSSLNKHDFYFSVGEQLLKDESKHDIFRSIPIERLFLETDDRNISIDEIYSLATQILKIDENELAQIIASNFKTIFGEDHL